MKKTAVLLIQLGTPDSPKTNDVRRYLSEFLNDPRVIDIPWLGRKLLVNGIIVPFRAPKSAKIYKELWGFGNGVSPLLTHSENLQNSLQKRFEKQNVTVHLAMRYQNPSMYDVMEQMHKENYDHIVILPLFPQYASASNGSAIELANKIIAKWWVTPEISVINQFYDAEGYIDSIIERAKAFNLSEYDHVLFSYHGLPERQVEKVHLAGSNCESENCKTAIGENNHFCYQATCYATTRLLTEKLGLNDGQYTVAFQSRLTQKWLMPFADKVVEQLAKDGAKKILVFSPAFVADCLETVVEISSEYQEIFKENGGEKVQLVSSSNEHPRFVDALEELVRKKL
ncbi:MAG: ferrochelatase [Fluviicola sp.]|nr:ferrochelatase [Fluviicola sp.]